MVTFEGKRRSTRTEGPFGPSGSQMAPYENQTEGAGSSESGRMNAKPRQNACSPQISPVIGRQLTAMGICCFFWY
jgi:hypothetical protein